MSKKISSYFRAIFRREQGSDVHFTAFLSWNKMSEYLVIRASALLIFYLILNHSIRSVGHLSQASYEQPIIFIELSKRLLGLLFQRSSFFWLVPILLLGIFLSVYYPRFRQRYLSSQPTLSITWGATGDRILIH